MDPRLEVFQGLRDSALRQRRERPGGDMAGVFIAEGDIVIERAMLAGFELHSILIDAKRKADLPASIDPAVPVYAVGPKVLERISGFHSYRGAMACFHRRPGVDAHDLAADPAIVSALVTEGVNNPVNLGVILRSAAGLGIDALFHDPTSCDPLSRRCCRVSMGESFAKPAAELPPLPDGLDVLHAAGFVTLALTPDASTTTDELSFAPTERVALVLGAEGPGLTDATLDACTRRVRIPMSGDVDSLNVGVAGGIAFYALQQSRRADC